ncbi:2-dehydro-3-deoxygalactonokinase [Aurantiacibacter flavus]|uniref:2-dehydro-3-deoxygalactonokinase n=1 Tax=Aurantiacibacter flavus TaxID=3145232 RepID=A0ABV0CUM1_9SPHN
MKQFIAGLWGTTQLQLFRIVDGSVADTCRGPGVSQMAGQEFEAVLLDLLKDWAGAEGRIEVLLAGMVGSSIGWCEVEYVPCPSRASNVLGSSVSVPLGKGSARILGGMACTNVLGEPDVMRGEEIELIGLEAMTSASKAGRSLVCIPGTHTKWVLLEDGVVESFLSSVTGEMFAGLIKSGVLASGQGATFDREVFVAAVGDAYREGASLVHLLFSARSRVASGKMLASHSADRLSGLLIGADVAGAVRSLELSPADHAEVAVIAMPAIGKRYVAALEELGFGARFVASQDAAVAGFTEAFRSLSIDRASQ